MPISSIVTRYLAGPRGHANHLNQKSGASTGQRQSAVLSRRELRALILDMVG